MILLCSYVRTAEDVKIVIEHAKLSVNDLKPNVQPIYFCEKFESYKLLELDEHILSELKCGQTYVSIFNIIQNHYDICSFIESFIAVIFTLITYL